MGLGFNGFRVWCCLSGKRNSEYWPNKIGSSALQTSRSAKSASSFQMTAGVGGRAPTTYPVTDSPEAFHPASDP